MIHNIFFLFSFITITCFSQDVERMSFTYGKDVTAIAEEGEYLWVGTSGGLVKVNKNIDTPVFYNVQNCGLLDNYITSVAIDKNGVKWIGTHTGIFKYDNNTWTNYNINNSPLPYDHINCITIDDSNNVWIGTFGGLAKISGLNWSVWTADNCPIPANNIRRIARDKNGHIWLAVSSPWGGLVKYDGTNWTIFKKNNSGIPDDYIWSINVDDENNKWIGLFDRRLIKYNDSSWMEIETTGAYEIASDNKNNIWFGGNKTAFEKYGHLCKYDGSNIDSFDSTNSVFSNNYNVRTIFIDSEGAIWVGTEDYDKLKLNPGLAKFDGSKWSFFSTYNSLLTSKWINVIASDLIGNKWFGTGEGLVKYDGKSWKVFNSVNSNLPNDRITALVFDKSNTLWIGSYGGLTKFDGSSWETFTTSDGLNWNEITSLCIDKVGKLWVGTTLGLCVYDKNGWYKFDELNSSIRHDERIGNIVCDHNNNIWVRHWSGYKLSKYANNGEEYSSLNWQTELYLGTPNFSMVNDSNDIIWLGRADGVLLKYSGSGLLPESYFIGEFIRAITVDSKNNLWLGTDNNLYKFDGEKSIASYKSSSYVNCVYIDDDFSIWVATGNGVDNFKENISASEQSYYTILDNYQLLQNFPNPFNPSTTIKYSVPKTSLVKLKVFDLLGNEVTTLVNEEKSVGNYDVKFDGSNLSSGIYFYQIKAGEFLQTNKLLLLK